MFRVLKVKGHSMSPSYQDGDYLLSASRRFFKLKIGDVIVINHPKYGDIIKEIITILPDGYHVQGKNSMSTSTKDFGLITPGMIQGKVIAKVFKSR